LVAQVDRFCPLCGQELFRKKKGKSFKHYEIAHIYPLNPSDAETLLLRDEPRLGADVNDLENLIPLCPGCHTNFDKPRTVEEYQQLYGIKNVILDRARHRILQYQYKLEGDIAMVVEALESADLSQFSSELSFDVKRIDEKFNDTLPPLIRRSIHVKVADYFVYVRQRLQGIEIANPGAGNLISSQVRAFYFAQKMQGWTQQQIFSNIVEWIVSTTKPQTREAAEIVASFFVQNCEVFE